MRTRRDFLSLAGLSLPAALLPFSTSRFMPGPSAPGELTYGLFFGTDALPELRARFNGDPLFAPLRERLAGVDRAAERRFLASDVQYNDQLIDLARIATTAQQMAFYYALTEDEDAADLSMQSLRTLMRFPRWDFFLEAGQHTFGLQRASAASLAVSLGIDWLGDWVGTEERKAWIRTMGERGCEACFLSIYGMRHPDRVVGWTIDEASSFFEHRPGERVDLSNWPRILNGNNLKAVPASALAIATVAYEREFGQDEKTERWMEQAVYSLRTFRDIFERDGSYFEGVSYAGYTALHLAQAFDVLNRHRGIDLYDTLNWPGYVRYIREMSLPTASDPAGIVNFGDAGGAPSGAVPFWVAARSRDPQSQWTGRHVAPAQDEWSLIWHCPDHPSEPPPARPRLWRSDLDWLVGRTGYAPDDLVVAMRSGGPANHEHADRNSLILKVFGEALIVDPRGAPYSFSDPAWALRTTAGHSALLIDGQGHQYHDGREGTNASDAEASVIRTSEDDRHFAWTSDATAAYRLVHPDVHSVTRTVLVLHELPAVLVLDKVLKATNPSRIQARFFADNRDGQGRVESAGDGFRTFRPGASLYARAHSPAVAQAASLLMPIPEDKARLHPFAEVGTHEASTAPFLITVLLPERGPGEQARAEIRPLDSGVYEVTCISGGRTATCRVFDTEAVPEYEISYG